MEEKENVCVEEKGAEQAVITAKGTEDGCPALGSAAPKKFKDADALARAYGALEAEFTRRSQRIKELEKEVEVLKSGLGGLAGTGAEKLRKNAEARRTAAKEFDKFVQGLGNAEVEASSEDGEKKASVVMKEGAVVGKTAVAEENVVVEEAAVEEAAEVEAIKPSVQPLESVVKGAGREDVLEQGTQDEEGKAMKAALQENGEALSVAVEERLAALSSEELYARVRQDEKVRLKIIGEYLSSLGKNVAPLTTGGVGSMLTPPIRAKSIADAGNLALQYLKKPFDL
jgi:hypothetical protein